jgi:hypothetical protein
MEDGNGKYFILPGNSYGLGVSIEKLNIPEKHFCPGDRQKHLRRLGSHRSVNTGRAGMARSPDSGIFQLLAG